MKKLFILSFLIISLASCKKKDYVSLEVKIDGLEKADSTLAIYGNQFMKVLKVDENGVFKDTFKIKEKGYFTILLGKKAQIMSFFENGYNLKISGKLADLNESILFAGKGAENSTYLKDRMSELNKFAETQMELMAADSATFNKKIGEFENKMIRILKEAKKLDTTLVRFEKEGLSQFVNSFKENYMANYITSTKFIKGSPAPKFVDYENFAGGKTSLDDLKGKFVYIDVWATWCNPCLAEIPALKELEKEYRNKNIHFVSISTDRKDDYQTWKNMVKEKELKGIQLYFGEDMNFMEAFNINSIPRFILIDPNGNIVDANAPRPSDPVLLKKLFADSGVK